MRNRVVALLVGIACLFLAVFEIWRSPWLANPESYPFYIVILIGLAFVAGIGIAIFVSSRISS